MFCQKCGKETAGDPAFCPSCGSRLAQSPTTKSSRLSMVAGTLDVIDGGLKLLGVLGLTIAMIALANDPYRRAADEVDPLVILIVITVPLAVLGILALVGGIYALRRKKWGVALAGAVAAALPFSLLGIAALVFTALSREEFD